MSLSYMHAPPSAKLKKHFPSHIKAECGKENDHGHGVMSQKH